MFRKVAQFVSLLALLFVFQMGALHAEEIPKFYQVICPNPNGSHNYYREAPDIYVKHLDENLITRYQLECPGGKKVVGRLEGVEKSEKISAEVFEEGYHRLDIWMEDKKGNVVSGTEGVRELNIDKVAPTMSVRKVSTEEERVHIGTEGKQAVELIAKDDCSGVAGIYYRVGDGEERYLQGERGFISVTEEAQETVSAYAMDLAGNISQVSELVIEKVNVLKQEVRVPETIEEEGKGNKTEEIEKEEVEHAPKLTIEGIEDNSIVGRDVKYVCRVGAIETARSVTGRLVLKTGKGEQKETGLTKWEQVGDEYICEGKLYEEGRYTISIEVVDTFGEMYMASRRIIVDKTSPMIRSLEELDGAKMESFQWCNNIEEWITDATTYTYEVRLDGVLCDENRVYKNPGKHVLELRVTDAAGNESRALATFQIVDTEEEETDNLSVLRRLWPCIALIIWGIVGLVWVIIEKCNIGKYNNWKTRKNKI